MIPIDEAKRTLPEQIIYCFQKQFSGFAERNVFAAQRMRGAKRKLRAFADSNHAIGITGADISANAGSCHHAGAVTDS